MQSQAEIADIDRQLQQYTGDAKSKTADQIRVRNQAGEIQAHSLESQLAHDLEMTRKQAISAVPKLQQAQVLEAEIDRLEKDYAAVRAESRRCRSRRIPPARFTCSPPLCLPPHRKRARKCFSTPGWCCWG